MSLYLHHSKQYILKISKDYRLMGEKAERLKRRLRKSGVSKLYWYLGKNITVEYDGSRVSYGECIVILPREVVSPNLKLCKIARISSKKYYLTTIPKSLRNYFGERDVLVNCLLYTSPSPRDS